MSKQRLIDADALKQEFVKYVNEPLHANDRHFQRCKAIVLDVLGMIAAAPTIDAIPVEWLKGLMLSTEDDVDKVEFAWIMREWKSGQKEQEVK